jgi:hypothetical protein
VQRLTRLTLLSMPALPREVLRNDRLFQALLASSPEVLAEARYAVSGVGQVVFPNAPWAGGQDAVARISTIADLLLAADFLTEHVSQVIAGDPAHPQAELAQARVASARQVFEGIWASVWALLKPGITARQARRVLERQTADWAEQMRLLYDVCDRANLAQVPVLARCPVSRAGRPAQAAGAFARFTLTHPTWAGRSAVPRIRCPLSPGPRSLSWPRTRRRAIGCGSTCYWGAESRRSGGTSPAMRFTWTCARSA